MTPQEIANTLWRAARIVGVSVDTIFTTRMKGKHPELMARRLAIAHLYRSGCSVDEIGKAIGKKRDAVSRSIYHVRHHRERYAELMDEMNQGTPTP